MRIYNTNFTEFTLGDRIHIRRCYRVQRHGARHNWTNLMDARTFAYDVARDLASWQSYRSSFDSEVSM